MLVESFIYTHSFLPLAEASPVLDPRPVASFSAPFIIGGSAVQITSHPHQVSLQSTSGSHSCGASILSTTKLVCAAHCTQ